MDLRWQNFGTASAASDQDWATLAMSTYDIVSARPTKGRKTLKLSPDEAADVGTLSSLQNTKPAFTINPISLDEEPTVPVSAPAADIVRKWNFDGTGRDDILFRQPNSGRTTILATNGFLYPMDGPTADYRLVGTGDFTGDGRADLLFSLIKNGMPAQYVVTILANLAGDIFKTPNNNYALTISSLGQVVLAIGDFNGDGKADLLRRDLYDGSGDVSVTFGTANDFGNFAYAFQSLSMAWSLAGVGDVNGDGRDDLIWRNVDNTVTSWIMGSNGVSFTNAPLASVGHEWRLEAVTRLNSADQINDLLWRNVVNGRTLAWIMNPLVNISSVVELGTFGFELDYYGARYDAGSAASGGSSAELLWRRSDGATIGTYLKSDGSVAFEALNALPTRTETHFRTKLAEGFNFGARGILNASTDLVEPMRTRHFGGMGASGGNTGRIPIIQASGGLTLLFGSGGGLVQFTPQVAAAGDFTFESQMVLSAMGDFNGDGIGIDLYYRDVTTGTSRISTWNNATGTYNSLAYLFFPAVDTKVIGVGNVDPTSLGDEIVSQAADGRVVVFRFTSSSGTVSNASGFNLRIQSSDWVGQGVIDLDGNGVSDIVWRNASTGAISYWAMNSSDPQAIRQVNISTTPVTLEWDLVGMGDLDGDGDGDLIWRRNTDGFLATWLFQGGQLGFVAGINSRGWDWRFEGTSDVNGDGKTDLIWRNTSGQYAADLMNGAVVTSTILSGAINFNRATMGWNQAFMHSL